MIYKEVIIKNTRTGRTNFQLIYTRKEDPRRDDPNDSKWEHIYSKDLRSQCWYRIDSSLSAVVPRIIPDPLLPQLKEYLKNLFPVSTKEAQCSSRPISKKELNLIAFSSKKEA